MAGSNSLNVWFNPKKNFRLIWVQLLCVGIQLFTAPHSESSLTGSSLFFPPQNFVHNNVYIIWGNMGTAMPLSKSLIILWRLFKHFVKYLFFANLVFSSRKVCFDLQKLNAVFHAAKNITLYDLLSPNILWFTEELYIYLALIPPGTSQHLNGKVLIGLSKDVSPMPRYSQAVVTWPHHLANSLHWNFVNEYLFDYIDIHPMLNKVYQTYVYIYPLFYVFLCFIFFKTDHFLILTKGYSIKTMFIVYL